MDTTNGARGTKRRQMLDEQLPAVVAKLVASVHAHPSTARLDVGFLPNRDSVQQAVDKLMQIMFPGYFGRQGLSEHNLPYRIGELVNELFEELFEPLRFCIRYQDPQAVGTGRGQSLDEYECDKAAQERLSAFFERLPEVRRLLATDVEACFEGDPAAQNHDETIFSYPGLYAIAVQRLAHEFYKMKVPLLPRIMTEYAHSKTGIDINPGAVLGERLFIDHGTGIVVGETCVIGRNVKIYQGVTLGALAPAYGQMLRGQKRHPTIEDDVTIYAGATILGGETVIGQGSTIGGNVFLTSSVPANHTVQNEPARLKIRDRRRRGGEPEIDFQI